VTPVGATTGARASVANGAPVASFSVDPWDPSYGMAMGEELTGDSLHESSAELVLACMSLLDVDDFAGAVSEIGRVLRPGGTLCLAVVHPFASAQDVSSMHTGAFRVTDPYLDQRRYVDSIERDGLAMTFTSMHRPLSAYTSALFANGMAITALTEGGAGTVPWLLALRAEKRPR